MSVTEIKYHIEQVESRAASFTLNYSVVLRAYISWGGERLIHNYFS